MIPYPENKAIEKFYHCGFKCFLVKKDIGGILEFYCGYVAVPKCHWAFSLEEKTMNPPYIFIHGGITFSTNMTEDFKVFGFDCSHASDDIGFWNRDRVIDEIKNLAEQFSKLPIMDTPDEMTMDDCLETLGVFPFLIRMLSGK